MRTTGLAISLVLVLACATPAQAADPKQLLNLTGANFLAIDDLVAMAKGRPNEEARLRGLKSYSQGQYADAAKAFQRSAYYADKFSQHYLSLMHWHGVGVSRDPVQAYIWADLAAERMSHRLLLVRERIWQELTPEQRAQVAERGQAFYARYGDEVAKPRAESAIRQFARDMTGSRVGARTQRLDTMAAPANGSFQVDTGQNNAAYTINRAATADALYGADGELLRLESYWEDQNRLIDGGKVEVGPLRPVRGRKADGGGGLDD